MLVNTYTQTAQELYGAFGRGDIATLLEAMTEDVIFQAPGAADLPWSGVSEGKAAVQEWFGRLAQSIEFQVFEPREFIAQGERVVAFVYTEIVTRHNGRKAINPEAHSWTFRDGKVVKFQVYHDTAVIEAAYRAA